jgi:arylsulfatase A-like enzyme
MADFAVAAGILDAGVGAILDALAAGGLADDTLVVCTTDHGPPFPGMKCNLTDGGLGVLLIARGPGGFTGGRVVDALVSQIDLFPTLCDLLGLARPAWLQGTSLLPLVRGEAEEVNEAIFGEVTYHALYTPQRCIRTRRWKYVRRFLAHPEPARGVIGNTDDGPSKRLWLRHGWAARPYAREELYDLVFDPHEGRNLAGDPAHAAVLAGLDDRLARWMRDTGDPLLHGPVPLPPAYGERLNPDGFRKGLGVPRVAG